MQGAQPAATASQQHSSDRELLLEIKATLEEQQAARQEEQADRQEQRAARQEQQGTLQLLTVAVHGLLATNAAQLHELSAVRTHQITQAVPQLGVGASVLADSSAQGVSSQPATKAAKLALKRSQQWEKRNLHRQHLQQTSQAEGQPASHADAAHTDGHADTTTAAPDAPTARSHPTAANPCRPPDAHDPDAAGPSAAAHSPAAPSRVPRLTQAQDSSLGFCPSTSLAPGVKIPGTDEPPWQHLNFAAYVNIAGEPRHFVVCCI